ncbi:hypothetical protein TNCV_1020011 [Trichonephila clavipes]|nr:hypothetical protein TNCV_1020011 [Trichonephila clavipes]
MQTRWCNVPVLQHSRFKLASPEDQGQIVAWFIEFKSATLVQHARIVITNTVGFPTRMFAVCGFPHCRRADATDKGCRVYLSDPHPDAVVLYPECTPSKRADSDYYRLTGTLLSLLASVVGGATSG